MPGYRLFVGVDIATPTATVAWQAVGAPATRPLIIEQSPPGFAALERRLRATAHAPADWLALATALASAGFAASVINAAQAHHFAKALLKRAKTDAIDAGTLAQVERYWRGHWTIENRVPYVRDVTLGEDACQIRAGSALQALAALRNALLSLLRAHGWMNIAAALRHDGAYVTHALALLGALPARL